MTVDLTYHIPPDRFYDGIHHTWVRWEAATGRAVVGIDALGLEALGELAYVSLSAVGTPVKRSQPIGTLEAAKMTTDLVAPVTGVLVDRNESVLRDPTLVNRHPYDEGWLVAIEPTNWDEESLGLIAGETLPAWVTSEIERYRSQGWID